MRERLNVTMRNVLPHILSERIRYSGTIGSQKELPEKKPNPEDELSPIGKETLKWVRSNPRSFDKKRRVVILDTDSPVQDIGDASDEHLKIQLQLLQDAYKWILQVYQAILMAGVIGVGIVLLNFTLDSFKAFTASKLDISSNTGWLFGLSFMIIFVATIVITNEDTGNPWLLDFMRERLTITHNMNERAIELFYITKTLEKNKQKRGKFCRYCGAPILETASNCPSCGKER